MADGIDAAINRMAETRILEAIEKGAFDNLSGRGKPLRLDDLSLVPDELRAGYILLKNSGFLPEEMELHKEIVSLQRLIDCCADDLEQSKLRKKLGYRKMQYEIVMERRSNRKKPPILR